ncbi:MAG: hypothetical protein Q7V01_07870, partial [Vicinamibacterales bacterium]|nr:hypothetical protein [Vicinamibacterales bacterium]
MEPDPSDKSLLSLRERFMRSWFPPAAVVGGIAALVVAAFRQRPVPKLAAPAAGIPAAGPLPMLQAQPAVLDWTYAPSGVVGGTQATPLFQRSLGGIALDGGDVVYALGDGDIRIIGTDGRLVRHWPVADTAQCLTVGPDGSVYVAGAGRIDVYDGAGVRTGGFAIGDAAKAASLTAIAVVGQDIVVADASARIIWRADRAGRVLGRIGDQHKTKAFILPSGTLDLAVDASGTVHATDTGRHQVTAWALDGTPVRAFGKFGMSDPSNFVGCCNPVNVALTPDGKVVTAEKMIARVKVFEPDGRLLA